MVFCAIYIMMKKPRISFSYKMDEKLIELVRAHEELYDTTNKKYSDTTFKNEVWKNIAEVFSLDIEMIKQRWESLRSQYRKNRRQKNKTGLAIGLDIKWKYEDQLDFLRAYMKERDVVTPQFFCEDTFVTSEEGEEAFEEECIADTSRLQNNNENLLHFSSSCNSVPLAAESSSNETGMKRKRKRKKDLVTGENVFCLLSKYLCDQEKTDLEPTVLKDELDLFFDSIKCTVKKFSEADKYLTKNKIFNIVSEIEAKYVNYLSQ